MREKLAAFQEQQERLRQLYDAVQKTGDLTARLGELMKANEALNAKIAELNSKLAATEQGVTPGSYEATPPANAISTAATQEAGVSREQIDKVALCIMVLADAAYKREDYLQACELLLSVEALGADDAETQFRIGRCYAAGGVYDKAIEHYEKALKKTDEVKGEQKAVSAMRLKILNNIGVARLKNEDNAGAEAAFREAVKIDATYAPALFNLALAVSCRPDGKAEAEELMRKYIAQGGERSATAAIIIENLKAGP